MASVEENSNLTKLQRKKVLSTLNSTDALALIEHRYLHRLVAY